MDKDLNVESMDNAASTVTANSKVAYSKIVQAYLLEDYYYVVVKISQIACRNLILWYSENFDIKMHIVLKINTGTKISRHSLVV